MSIQSSINKVIGDASRVKAVEDIKRDSQKDIVKENQIDVGKENKISTEKKEKSDKELISERKSAYALLNQYKAQRDILKGQKKRGVKTLNQYIHSQTLALQRVDEQLEARRQMFLGLGGKNDK